MRAILTVVCSGCLVVATSCGESGQNSPSYDQTDGSTNCGENICDAGGSDTSSPADHGDECPVGTCTDIQGGSVCLDNGAIPDGSESCDGGVSCPEGDVTVAAQDPFGVISCVCLQKCSGGSNPLCGNGVCDASESVTSCPVDCGDECPACEPVPASTILGPALSGLEKYYGNDVVFGDATLPNDSGFVICHRGCVGTNSFGFSSHQALLADIEREMRAIFNRFDTSTPEGERVALSHAMAAFFNAIRPHLELNEDENNVFGDPWPESVIWNWECRSNSQNSTVGMFLMQRWSLLRHHRLASIDNNMSHYWANVQEIETVDGQIQPKETLFVDSFYGSGFWADGGQMGDLPVYVGGVQPGGTERYGKWLFILASE